MQPVRVLETSLYADDLDGAADFYHRVLGLEPMAAEPGRHVFFRCGPGMLLIFRAQATSAGSGGIPGHGASGPGHVAFAVSAETLASWTERLRSSGVAIESEVSWPGGGRSIYFRDPAGNSLELATPAVWGLKG